MKLINCKKCGLLFKRKLRDICDSCLEKENKSIEIITKFIEKYQEPFVSKEVISENTNISVEEIKELYKNGRLMGIANRIIIKCRICSAEIKGVNKKGNFCIKCTEEMISGEIVRKPVEDPEKIKVNLRKFHKDVVHSNKEIPAQERMKYGFKKSYD